MAGEESPVTFAMWHKCQLSSKEESCRLIVFHFWNHDRNKPEEKKIVSFVPVLYCLKDTHKEIGRKYLLIMKDGWTHG